MAPPGARALYVQSLEGDPHYAPAWARLGRCHRIVGKSGEDIARNLEKAEACLRRALDLNPNLLPMRTFLESLRALLEGRRHESFDATERSVLHFQDPEPRFYMARQLARLGESRRAFEVLGDVLDCGYVCSRALDRDPWLEPLRGFVEFQRLRARAFALERERRELFVRAGGLRCGLQISAVGP